MNKRRFGRLIAAFLAVTLFFGAAADYDVTVQAANSAALSTETSVDFFGTGRMQEQFLALDLDSFTGQQYDAADLAKSADTVQSTSTAFKASQIYNDDWDQYSTNYYYNLMDDSQREFWDALDTLCLSYLTKKQDMKYYAMYGCYVTDFVYSTKLSKEVITLVTSIFRYSNPQYYFIEPIYLYSSSKTCLGISMAVYDDFASGADRSSATKDFKKEIQSWLKDVQSTGATSDYEIVKAIHDQIVNNTEYNYSALDGEGGVVQAKESKYKTQSAYSTFCYGSTVCAGYAQAFELLCSALDIDAIIVTSETHEWNKVRMEDSWYNVDCTWDDQGEVSYQFFAKSDNAYNNELPQSESHIMETFWSIYAPECSLDSGSTYSKAGTLPEITETTALVEVTTTPIYATTKTTKTKYISGYRITLSCATDGAVIYYTTDGSTPSVASGISRKYTGAITITEKTKLSAIAVSNGRYDSGITVDETFGSVSYAIKYVLKGGENSDDNPETYSASDATFTLKAPTRKGYKFAGWYTDKEYTTRIKKIKKGTTGKITLYAKWTPISYKVKFDGNGATSGSVKTKTYKYGKSYKLPANKFKRKGYTFVGWNTKKNGKGTTYKDKKSIKNLTAKAGKTITLYAQWKKN